MDLDAYMREACKDPPTCQGPLIHSDTIMSLLAQRWQACSASFLMLDAVADCVERL